MNYPKLPKYQFIKILRRFLYLKKYVIWLNKTRRGAIIFNHDLKTKLFSAYTIFIIVASGMLGFFIFESVVDENGSVFAAKTIIVDMNGTGNYTKIQDAINASNPGDIIRVWSGIYNESLNINKTLSIIGNSSGNTTIKGYILPGSLAKPVISLRANWINFTGFKVTKSLRDWPGLTIYGKNFCNISNNIFKDNGYGITLQSSNNNLILNNIIFNNTFSNNDHIPSSHGSGIVIGGSNNNLVNNNSISNNKHGIFLFNSINNTLKNNNFTNNGVSISGSQKNWATHDIDTTNKVNNKPLYYFKNQQSQIISQDAGQIILANCSNFIIKDQIINHSSIALILGYSNNNSIINNIFSNNFVYGLQLYYSNQNNIKNNTCNINSFIGIKTGYSINNEIINCTCNYNNKNNYSAGGGIILEYSSDNIVRNCNAFSNYKNGIRAYYYSNKNLIRNNYCFGNEGQGIEIYSLSYNNEIENNTCINNYHGIKISSETSNNIVKNNKLLSNLESGIYLMDTSFNSLINNICNSNIKNGIYFTFSFNNTIQDCILKSNNYGIYCYDSYSNIINNSILKLNNIGILIRNSDENYLIKNQIISNICGISLQHRYIDDKYYGSDYNYLFKNNCSSNLANGIHLLGSDKNNISANSVNSNNENGIRLEDSDYNILYSNNCNFNNISGISSRLSRNSNIVDNKCNYNNNDGMYFYGSSENEFINNQINWNEKNGIYIQKSQRNEFLLNECNWNYENGIYLEESSYITFDKNNISFNSNIGIHLYDSIANIYNNNISRNVIGLNFNLNTFGGSLCKENLIGFNSGNGIILSSNSNNNQFFHNNIIQNHQQAIDFGDNFWDYDEEGNYWSDYIGVDNGSNSRRLGDNIGDTNIPHLGLDNFPYLKQDGWYLLQAPYFEYTNRTFYDTNFTIYWFIPQEVDGFVLDEDQSEQFLFPKEIYQNNDGSIMEFTVRNKEEGTYYFRVRSFIGSQYSIWSNILRVNVDLPPKPPNNFTLSHWPEGNALNISWNLNIDDTIEYEIYYKLDSNWKYLKNLKHPISSYNHTGLKDGIEYSYKIRAIDSQNRRSIFASPLSGIPTDSVAPDTPINPVILKITENSTIISWNRSVANDVIGYNVYRSNISNPVSWGIPVNGDELIRFIEYTNKDLEPGTVYYFVVTAVDEVPNESNISKILKITTTWPNEFYPPPEVNRSQTNIMILEDTIDNSSINLFDWFKDLNGYPLVFNCYGNKSINVTINNTNGAVLLKPKHNWNGQEIIRFYAWDGLYDVIDSVVVTVTPVNDPPEIPIIIQPTKGTIIRHGSHLDFQGTCIDPDEIYGDILTFNWYSDIVGFMGTGTILNEIKLPVGDHVINLTVTDSSNLSANTSIKIIVQQSSTSKVENDNLNLVIGSSVVIIIIVLIILLLILFRYKRKKLEKISKIVDDKPTMKESKENINFERTKDRSKSFITIIPEEGKNKRKKL